MRYKWQVAEHPLIEVADMDRSSCIDYVETRGAGDTSEVQLCRLPCSVHEDALWRIMKKNDLVSFADAVAMGMKTREIKIFEGKEFLDQSGKRLDEVNFQEVQMERNDWSHECEGVCRG